MKNLIFITALTFGLSTTALANQKRDCFRGMSNISRAEILMQKKCNLIIRDFSNKPVKKVEACFSKLKDQYKGKISYALTADITNDDRDYTTAVMIANVTNAIENDEKIDIEVQSTARNHRGATIYAKENIIFNKSKSTLVLNQKFKIPIGDWYESYDMVLKCQ